MTKKIILAVALAAAVAAVAAPSFAEIFHNHRMEPVQGNFTCSYCNGTGRNPGPGGLGTGNMKCTYCNGTGFRGGY